jgi:hypothetical protein
MSRQVVAATVATLALVAGCDGGAPRQDPDRDPVQAAADDAAVRLDAAVERVLTSGRYRQTVTTPGLDDPYYEVTGAYDVERRRFSADMAFWNPEAGETRRIEHRYLGPRGFQQAQGWQGRVAGCWLVFDADADAVTDAGGRGAPTRAPDAVTALDGARGRSTTDGSVVSGTIGLAAALSLMLPGYLQQQAPPAAGRVPASFTLDEDGALTGWQVRGDDVVPALDRAGQDLTSGFATGLRTFTVEIAYEDVGERVDVQAPPRSLWMTADQMEARRGCAGS